MIYEIKTIKLRNIFAQLRDFFLIKCELTTTLEFTYLFTITALMPNALTGARSASGSTLCWENNYCAANCFAQEFARLHTVRHRAKLCTGLYIANRW